MGRRKFRPLRRLRAVVTALLALALVALLAIYFFARLPATYEVLEPRLNRALGSAGVHVETEQVTVDLLGSVQIRGLEVAWRDPAAGALTLRVPTAAVTFRPWPLVFGGRLVIDRIQLTELEAQGALTLDAPATEPTPPEPFDWRPLEQLLATPPLAVELAALEIAGGVEIGVRLASGRLDYEGPIRLTGRGGWTRDGAELDGRLLVGMGQGASRWSGPISGSGPSVELTGRPSLDLPVSATLVPVADAAPARLWQVQVSRAARRIAIDDVRLTGAQGEVALDQLAATLTGGIEPTSTGDARALDPFPLHPLAVETSVSATVTGLVGAWAVSDAPTAAALDLARPTRFELAAQINAVVDDLTHPWRSGYTIAADHDIAVPELRWRGPEETAELVGLTSTGRWTLRNAQDRVLGGTTRTLQTSIEGRSETALTGVKLERRGGQSALAAAGMTWEIGGTTVVDSTGPAGDAALVNLVTAIDAQNTIWARAIIAERLGLAPDMTSRLRARDLRLIEAGRLVSAQSLDVQTRAKRGPDSAIVLANTLDIASLEHPEAPFPMDAVAELAVDSGSAGRAPRATVSVTGRPRAETEPTVRAELSLEDRSSALVIEHTLWARPQDRLYATLAPLAESRAIAGQIEAQWSGRTTLEHGAGSILQADWTNPLEWHAASDSTLLLQQRVAPTDPTGIRLRGPARIGLTAHRENGRSSTTLRFAVPDGLTGPLSQEPLAVALDLTVSADDPSAGWRPQQLRAQGGLDLNGTRRLNLDVTADDAPGRGRLAGHIDVVIDPTLGSAIEPLAALAPLGALDVELTVDSVFEHSTESILELTPQHVARGRLDLNTSASIAQRTPGASALTLAQPLRVEQDLRWDRDAIRLNARLAADALQATAALSPLEPEIEGLVIELELTGSNGLAPQALTGALRMDAARALVTLVSEPESPPNDAGADAGAGTGEAGQRIDVAKLAFPAQASGSVDVQGTRINVDRFVLTAGDQLGELRVDGSVRRTGGSGQLSGTAVLDLDAAPERVAATAVSGRGQLTVPWRVHLIDGQQIAIDGRCEFNQFDLQVGGLHVGPVNGQISFSEELELVAGERVRFRYYVSADPFQEADFARIQPFLDRRRALQVGQLRLGEQGIGPLIATMDLEQNLLRLSRLDLAMFDGHVSGQLYLDATPGAWRIGLLARATGVDLRYLLSETRSADRALTPVNARIAAELDVSQRLLEGRIDITDISREQLLQILDVLDPEHADEQLAPVRTALLFAAPRWVIVEMSQGLLDMSVSVPPLAKPLTVRGVPLSPLLQQGLAEPVRLLEALPVAP